MEEIKNQSDTRIDTEKYMEVLAEAERRNCIEYIKAGLRVIENEKKMLKNAKK